MHNEVQDTHIPLSDIDCGDEMFVSDSFEISFVVKYEDSKVDDVYGTISHRQANELGEACSFRVTPNGAFDVLGICTSESKTEMQGRSDRSVTSYFRIEKEDRLPIFAKIYKMVVYFRKYGRGDWMFFGLRLLSLT